MFVGLFFKQLIICILFYLDYRIHVSRDEIISQLRKTKGVNVRSYKIFFVFEWLNCTDSSPAGPVVQGCS